MDIVQEQAVSLTPTAAAMIRKLMESKGLEGGIVASGVLAPREDTAIFSEVSGYRVARVMADDDVEVFARIRRWRDEF